MKEGQELKYFVIGVGKKIISAIYFFFKVLLKTKRKITFMSRQTNGKNLDFDMLVEELKEKYPDVEAVILNKRLEKDFKSKTSYVIHMFSQMYHMATSKVIIIDSYSILVSILKQKKTTKVIQIWHALGSLKKFGYSILGKKEGRNSKTAKAMNMHKNYDYALTSSEVSKGYFAEAFGMPEEKMIVLGLPRIDFLRSEKAKKAVQKRFYEIYKDCNNKKENILYVPTDRKNKRVPIEKVIKAVDYSKYNLIIKTHSGKEKLYVDNKKIDKGNFFLGIALLHIADYIITDYSAICYEAALVEKPIYFYTYDYTEYMKNRGVYIDFKKEMPGFISKDIKKIMNKIEKQEWNLEAIRRFSDKYMECKDLKITEKLVNIIMKLANEEELIELNYTETKIKMEVSHVR